MTKTEQNRVVAWRLKLLHEASVMPRNEDRQGGAPGTPQRGLGQYRIATSLHLVLSAAAVLAPQRSARVQQILLALPGVHLGQKRCEHQQWVP